MLESAMQNESDLNVKLLSHGVLGWANELLADIA
jgi:hypothetical protein